jgi:hypothetical protein
MVALVHGLEDHLRAAGVSMSFFQNAPSLEQFIDIFCSLATWKNECLARSSGYIHGRGASSSSLCTFVLFTGSNAITSLLFVFLALVILS